LKKDKTKVNFSLIKHFARLFGIFKI
jgi:hypothetical protein